jgi:hypothetical protein
VLPLVGSICRSRLETAIHFRDPFNAAPLRQVLHVMSGIAPCDFRELSDLNGSFNRLIPVPGARAIDSMQAANRVIRDLLRIHQSLVSLSVRERLADNEPYYVGGVKVFQGCEDNPFHLNTHGTER